METSSLDIAKRLEALNKWHEEYRTLLQNKHEQQRALLGTSVQSNLQSLEYSEIIYSSDADLKKDYENLPTGDDKEEIPPELSKQTSGYSTDSKIDVEADRSSADIADLPRIREENQKKSKHFPKKFLRKGEGLKQRFKIEPDAFNLNKLPPYKYAKAHPQLRRETTKKVKTKVKIKDVEKPESLKADDLVPLPLDAQEKRFQQLLFASKTIVNSTPDSKLSNNSTLTRSSLECNSELQIEKAKPASLSLRQQQQQMSAHSVGSTNSIESFSLDMMWAKVLDPFKIKPVPISKIREQQHPRQEVFDANETEDENLNLFELLEKRAEEGSFRADCSVIKRVLAKKDANTKDDDLDSDIIPISVEIRKAHIDQRVEEEDLCDSSESEKENSSEEEDEEEEEEQEQQTATNNGADDTCPNDNSEKTPPLRVHFAEDSTLNENEETTMLEEETLPDMNSEFLFEQVKSLVFAALTKNEKSIAEASFQNNSLLDSKEIKKLAEQGKERVAELERQIALFKETNTQLMRSKQEHELEKAHFEQIQEEALEKLNDEKVRMEIQIHDERMKLEEERRKFEEKLRMQKTALVSNERKEITKLKEEIQTLKAKLRDKDQAHIAAQGRIRSQVRCLEKEQKTLYAEIERLQKENKKLEKLHAQLSRERNVNMLQEINRNIVKLAGSQSNTTGNCETVSNSTSSNNSKSLVSSKSSLVEAKVKAKAKAAAEKTMKVTTTSFAKLFSKEKKDEQEIKATDENLKDLKPHEISISSDEDDLALEVEDEDSLSNQKEKNEIVSEQKENSPPPQQNETSKSVKQNFKVLTRETITPDGGKEILYPNGTIRKESGDGLTVSMMYFNGDVKETNVNEGTIKYYYAKTNTWHTTYLDGLEIIEFPNGQIEHRHPNGIIEIHFPNNNCIKVMDPKDENNLAEWRFHDGSTLTEMRNGDKLLTLSNGQKELHTKDFKRRQYPDGTVKTVFPDGSYETRYSNGRLRLKDKDGNLVLDTEQ